MTTVETDADLDPGPGQDEPMPPATCIDCGGIGRRAVGWDKDMNEIVIDCELCGGTRVHPNA